MQNPTMTSTAPESCRTGTSSGLGAIAPAANSSPSPGRAKTKLSALRRPIFALISWAFSGETTVSPPPARFDLHKGQTADFAGISSEHMGHFMIVPPMHDRLPRGLLARQ